MYVIARENGTDRTPRVRRSTALRSGGEGGTEGTMKEQRRDPKGAAGTNMGLLWDQKQFLDHERRGDTINHELEGQRPPAETALFSGIRLECPLSCKEPDGTRDYGRHRRRAKGEGQVYIREWADSIGWHAEISRFLRLTLPQRRAQANMQRHGHSEGTLHYT